MVGPQFKSMPERWVSILAVDDVDARLKKATAAGAKVMKPPFDIPDVGRVAYLEEPGGAMIGWLTPVETSSKDSSKSAESKKREPAKAR
jgi:predicted enzyme related to lactoylglutathione lyase